MCKVGAQYRSSHLANVGVLLAAAAAVYSTLLCATANAKEGKVAVPPPRPPCESVGIRLYPNGAIKYFPDLKDNGLFCLVSDPGDSVGWGLNGDVRITQYSADGRPLPVPDLPNTALPNTPYSVQPTKAEPQEFTPTTISQSFSSANPKVFKAVDGDAGLRSKVSDLLKQQDLAKDPTTDVASAAVLPKYDTRAKNDIDAALKALPPVVVFDGDLPTATAVPLVPLDAAGTDSRVPVDLVDGTTVRAWAYNVSCDGQQTIAIKRGPAIVSSATILTQLGTIFVKGAPAWGFKENGVPEAFASSVADLVDDAIAKHSAGLPLRHYCQTVFKTTVVDGGFNYTVQAAAAATDPAKAPPTQQNGSAAFKTYSPHRLWSLGVELAWNSSVNGFPVSGFGYQPIAQSGPDQLYQLQELKHVQDEITTSALLLIYPVNFFTHERVCASQVSHLLCTDGLVTIGFGPTFLRGGSGEFARQWNLRGGIEVVPDLVLLVGLSWRAMDVPNVPGVSLNSIVSSPKPAMTPVFSTAAQADYLFSIGMAVDLDFLSGPAAAGAATVSKAVSGNTGGNP
jgi:hypothetical protein